MAAVREGDPCAFIETQCEPSRRVSVVFLRQALTLIFAIATLDFFVDSFLHFSLEDPCPRGFVKVGDL